MCLILTGSCKQLDACGREKDCKILARVFLARRGKVKHAGSFFVTRRKKVSPMKRAWRILTACAASLSFAVCTAVGVAGRLTCDSYRVLPGMSLSWNGGVLSAASPGSRAVASYGEESKYEADLMLFHAIPVKTVSVSVVEQKQVIPCGMPFGIKMFTDGVMVVGTAEIQTESGLRNPAAEAGIQMGDIVETVNGQDVNRNEEIAAIVEQSGGKPVLLNCLREGKSFSVSLLPAKSQADGLWKAGIWVRDSTAGIGTLTFYDPESQTFGGLGHGVCDTDTSELMPFLNGEIMPVTISGVTKGQRGIPGELRGYFASEEAIGLMDANDEFGVYGSLYEPVQGELVPVAFRQEAHPGSAQILTTVNGDGPQLYEVTLEHVDYNESAEGKNLVLHVTDARLLELTGGIVQGMSGSPILQDGKLIGAVTHVFVNDPTRGYGIFIETMLETMA